MKIVGRRKVGFTTPEDADRLLRTAWAVRGTYKLVPKGLYRFRSFEEADEWMRRAMASTTRTYAQRPSTLCNIVALKEDASSNLEHHHHLI